MSQRGRDKLHVRVTAWIALAGAGVATLVVVVMSASGIREEFSRQGLARTRQLSVLADSAARIGVHTYLMLTLQAVAGSSDVLEVAWLEADGSRAVSTAPGGLQPETRERLERVLAHGAESVHESSGTEHGAMLFAVPAGPAGDLTGVAALRLSTSGLASARRTLILYNMSAALLGVAAMTAAAWWLLGWLLKPVAAVAEAIGRLADGASDPGLAPHQLGALAPVGHALAHLSASHRDIDRRIAEIAERHDGVIERMLEATAGIREDLQTQRGEVAAAAERLSESGESIAHVEGEIEGVLRLSGDAVESLERLGLSLDRVWDRMSELEGRVSGSASASVEMAASIRQVAENAGSVRESAGETAASVSRIDAAIQAVSAAVREASGLSDAVRSSAEQGEGSIREIVTASQETRMRAAAARDTHRQLDARIAEIGGIAESIDAINRETNMLALNASIVAARAGESGRSFAVVAERVRALASQTAASTAQIEQHLQALQAGSSEATLSLDAALECIERNVSSARATGETFEGIRSSAARASERIGEIEQLAAEQGFSSRRVAEAARSTSQMMEVIGAALEQQKGASVQTSKTAEAALEACREVMSAAQSQRSTGRAVADSIGSLDGRMGAIHDGLGHHVRASRAVSDAVGKALAGGEESARRMSDLAEAAQALRADWARLRSELARLRGGGSS